MNKTSIMKKANFIKKPKNRGRKLKKGRMIMSIRVKRIS